MASNYSPLKIELITTGEQSGTWGTTTNVNLGTAIEEAITGTANVTFASADITLTLTNTNGSQTARNLRLRLTGTTGGARELIVPPIEKQYIVQNDTLNTVTIKNATGTGVAIPSLVSAIVFNDGVNITSAGTYATALVTPLLAATDAAFVNALPVTSGGTGVTTATGSGSVVRATSPTLVTPALGTPASGVLTNATGLPVSTGVSGLGTGVATALGVAIGSAGAPVVNGGALGTPTSGVLTNCTGLPMTTGITGTLPVANGGTGVTSSTGTGNVVLSNSPTLVTPALGTPASGTLTSCTGLPMTTGVTGTLPVLNGGTGVTTSTGSGNTVLSTSPTLVTPILGTPTSGTLTNCTGLPVTTGVSGLGANVATFLATPSSANLAAALTDETGTGSAVFATSPTLVTPDLGTPSALVGTNISGTAANLTAGLATKLTSTSGTAPVYGARAMVNFNADSSIFISGTYSQSGTTVTATITGHGFKPGQGAFMNLTSGTGVDGIYTIATVPTVDTFTYTAGTSLTTSGSLQIERLTMRANFNVDSVSVISTGAYFINFTVPMPTADYVTVGSSSADIGLNGNSIMTTSRNSVTYPTTTGYTTIFSSTDAGNVSNVDYVNVVVFA